MRIKEVDPSSSPLAAFGWQLRRLRERAGLTQGELGDHVGYSGAYVSLVELAKRKPEVQFAKDADRALATNGTLEGMWWLLGHTALIEGFPEFAQHEGEAILIRLFELGVIPGLLQTQEYAEALEDGAVSRGSITVTQAAERVAFLLVRQAPMDRTSAPRVKVILDESCLRTVVGSPAVMARQLAHLECLARRPNVVIQVAPFSLGARRPFMHPVTLLTLRDGTVLGYTETHQRGYLERDKASVEAWTRDYDLLQVEALSQADSLAVIRKARKELCNMQEDLDLSGARWLKSSYSGNGGQCVEIAPEFIATHGIVPVRDSKDPEGPKLTFTVEAWAAFAQAAASGAFGDA